LIPILRALTRPLRAVPLVAGAITALILGGAIGIGVFALVTKTQLAAFVDHIQDTIHASPGLAVGVTLGLTLIPMLVGVVLERE
jgi:ABC-type antimicrobial peptide transport system permease subunit